MKETDYVGLSHFQEFCKDLDEQDDFLSIEWATIDKIIEVNL